MMVVLLEKEKTLVSSVMVSMVPIIVMKFAIMVLSVKFYVFDSFCDLFLCLSLIFNFLARYFPVCYLKLGVFHKLHSISIIQILTLLPPCNKIFKSTTLIICG